MFDNRRYSLWCYTRSSAAAFVWFVERQEVSGTSAEGLVDIADPLFELAESRHNVLILTLLVCSALLPHSIGIYSRLFGNVGSVSEAQL